MNIYNDSLELHNFVSNLINEERKALVALNYSSEMLIDIAAEALTYLKISNYEVDLLAAGLTNKALNLIRDSSLNPAGKEQITEKVFTQLRVDIAKIRLDRNKEVASSGGRGKDEKTGSREKREKIWRIWAEGQYSSRDICAEEECEALGMSFSTARKALRKTPDPSLPS